MRTIAGINTQISYQVLVLGFAFLSACFLPGCGGSSGDRPELGMVTGQVLLDGKPLVGVNVLFVPESGRASAGVTDNDGRYQLEYTHRVPGAKIGPGTFSIEYPTDSSGPPIPSRYAGESELQRDVKAGSQVFDFDLTSK